MNDPALPFAWSVPACGKQARWWIEYDGDWISSNSGGMAFAPRKQRLHVADRLAACVTSSSRAEQITHGLADIISISTADK